MRNRHIQKNQTNSNTNNDNKSSVNDSKSSHTEHESTVTSFGKNKNRKSKKSTLVWLSLALVFGYAHFKHIESMFERVQNFSALSTIERELSFRTESGLYYFYFKSLVVDENHMPLNRSLVGLIYDVIVNDDRTEYPNTINSLQRFNLYPEVVLAAFYRISNSLGLLKNTCYMVR